MAKKGSLNQLAAAKKPKKDSLGFGDPTDEPAIKAGKKAERFNRSDFGGKYPGHGGREGDPGKMDPATRQQSHHKAQAAAGREMQSKMGENDPRRYMNPRKLYKRSMGKGVDSEYAPYSRMRNVEDAKTQLGFGGPQEQLTGHYTKELEEGAPVDYQEGKREEEEWRPQVNQLQEYAMSHLGEGLMPEEEAAIRGRMRDSLSASQQQAGQEQGAALAASGLTGSGIGAGRALQLERAQQQGSADIEREVTLQDLARKKEMEDFAQSTAGVSMGEAKLAEAGREYDVTAEQARQKQVEAGVGDIAGLESGQFNDLLTYAENARQAKAARAASRKAAQLAEPTGLETAGTIVGSIL